MRALTRHARRLGAAAVAFHLAAGTGAAQPSTPAPGRTAARTHAIVQGDTLGAIANRYGVTVAAIVAANRLASDRVTLPVGRRLVIPPASAGAASPRATRRVPTPQRGRAGPHGPRDLVLAIPDFVEASPGFAWPAEGPVTSTFGRRRSGWHRGIDIRADQGSPVVAAAAGTVIVIGWEPRYGRVVKLEHDHGFVTVYAHNEENVVEVGDRVLARERIATVGRTGRATTHHLHFEVRRDGRAYNPLYLLPLPLRVAQVEENGEHDDDE